MPDRRDGKIVTFYSYKGGTGRTMALANVAWILAANGRRVLVADWDLESPGLYRFYRPFMDTEIRDAPGVIDMIRKYERDASAVVMKAGAEFEDDDEADAAVAERIQPVVDDCARVQRYAFSLDWDFPDGGGLDFLSSGRQNDYYVATLGALDWDRFYTDLRGALFFDRLRADMKRHYDYVLIDSRTGLSDIADICTVHLPDVLVDCFTLSIQGTEGAAQVARTIKETYAAKGIRILPVPMRVDPAEKEMADTGRAVAARLFHDLPAGLTAEQRQEYWGSVEVPYQPFYAYEETLAVFGDPPGSPRSLLSSFERLTAQITEHEITALPPLDPSVRLYTRSLFTRRLPAETNKILLDHSQDDELWAEWIAGVLRAAGLDVAPQPAEETPLPEVGGPAAPRVLSLITPAYLEARREPPSPDAGALAVYVTDMRPPAHYPSTGSVSLAGMHEQEAIKYLFRLVGIVGRASAQAAEAATPRYPGDEPKIFQAPARNVRFTGRQEDLRRLRTELNAHHTAVVLPVALQGLGGVGKTQVALEYAYQYKSDYDLVWWIDCEQPQFIDASLVDLGWQIQNVYQAGPSTSVAEVDVARTVLTLLSQSRVVDRWLVVFDNAELPEKVMPLVPSGSGHVLITSRNRAWSDRARPLTVDVFSRAESVQHLHDRVGSITDEEADQVAEVLGDLPLAVATAAAWLDETGTPVADYLLELERQGPQTLSISQITNYPLPLARAWDLSLDRLRQHSPAAARLFELCSVLAPDIGLELLYNPAMAAALVPLDPALSEPMVMGRVIQEINRLALLKLDSNGRQIKIHRLVQAVVRDRMTEAEISAARRIVHEVLAAARPREDVDDPRTWDRYRLIWPHLQPSGAVRSTEEPVRQLFIDRVRYLWQRDDLEPGESQARQIEADWAEMLAAGDDPALRRQLLHLQFHLANILRDLARFKESHELNQALLVRQRELLGEEHPHTLLTSGSLAAGLRALGEYANALDQDKVTHRSWSELFNENHSRTLAAANNLATSHRLMGDYAAAFALDTDILARRQATLGTQHPLTLHSATSVGCDLLEAGQYAEAATRMADVVQTSVQALGRDFRATLNAQVLLGVALRGTGRAEEAEQHFTEAARRLERRFGADSSDMLACRLSRAANWLVLDRFDQARTEIRAVQDIYERRLGPDHPHTLACGVNLVSALRLSGDGSSALPLAETTAARLRETLGPEHPYTLAARMVLAVLLADEGVRERAAEIEEETVELMDRKLKPTHPDALRCRANLLLTRHELGEHDALEERQMIIDRLGARLGAGHPNIVTLREGRRLLRALDPQRF
ncbi:tetratricopeptide repeat protein [Actinomadura craniellae]|uniref:Tetratricopeptide repeat protein n=1 Tax=Actinomadura craniellae TaxID=2231787 RepID=A0A365HAB2_9ACTN|nr:FxSxx-COOH system tetratricopeptide repeat protein [Actinomadura craniellae]RAY15952.1 tetratricopeptide repeat protein [Actinomadura craniellae]